MRSHLCNHHMAVKGPLAVGMSRPANMRADLGDNGSSKGDIGDEMAIHDIDMEPVRPLGHFGRAFLAELREIGAEDGGSYNGGGAHSGVRGEVGREEVELRGTVR